MLRVRSSLSLTLCIFAFAICLSAQNARAPRLDHPELLPVEKAEDINERLEPVYDKLKNETTFFLSGMLIVAEAAGREVQVQGESKKRVLPSGVIKMVVYYKFTGKTKTKPEDVIIAFNAGNASDFEFQVHRNLSMATTTDKFEFGQMKLTATNDEGFKPWGFIRYWETLELPIKLDTYKKIIESKNVSMQIGDTAASLSSSQLNRLRKYIKSLE